MCDASCLVLLLITLSSTALSAIYGLQIYLHQPARVFVRPALFSPAECAHVVGAAEASLQWSNDRHGYYPTEEIAVATIPALANVSLAVNERLVPLLRRTFMVAGSQRIAVADLFVVRYRVAGQRGLRMHIDDSTLSFSVALSEADAYAAGGLEFQLSGAPQRVEQGTAVLHPSRLYHRGADVEAGTRHVLVGFVSVGVDAVFALDTAAAAGAPEHMHGLFARCVRTTVLDEQEPDHYEPGMPYEDQADHSHYEEVCHSSAYVLGSQLYNKLVAVGDGVRALAAGDLEGVSDDSWELIQLNLGLLLFSAVVIRLAG